MSSATWCLNTRLDTRQSTRLDILDTGLIENGTEKKRRTFQTGNETGNQVLVEWLSVEWKCSEKRKFPEKNKNPREIPVLEEYFLEVELKERRTALSL